MNIEQMSDDLHKHLCDRIRQVLSDHVGTCRAVRLPARDIASIAFSALLSEATLGAIMLSLNEEEFLKVCLISHRFVNKQNTQPKRKKQDERNKPDYRR
jgi:hypothetical protein